MTKAIEAHLHYINYLNYKRSIGLFAKPHVASMPEKRHLLYPLVFPDPLEFVGEQKQFSSPNKHPYPSGIHNIPGKRNRWDEAITSPLQFRPNVHCIIDNQSKSFHSYLLESFPW